MRDALGDPGTAAMNLSIMDGEETPISTIRTACDTPPFLGDRRLVIVSGLLSRLLRRGADGELEALLGYLPRLPRWAILVLEEPDTLPKGHPIFKAAADMGDDAVMKRFAPPENPMQWIRKRAGFYGAEIEPGAAAMLAAAVDGDLHAADNELSKLAAFVDGKRPITRRDVELLASYASEVSVFEMVDALGRRDGAAALRSLHRLLEGQHPLSLFGMVVRQFRLMLEARSFLEGGGSAGELPHVLKVPPFVARKINAQSRNFSLEQLEMIYRRLLELDVEIKTGHIDGELALDMLIAGLAG